MKNNKGKIIQNIFATQKGILAADERPKTMDARLLALGISDGPETRSQYRDMLFSTARLEAYISGIILSLDTLEEQQVNGIPLHAFFVNKDIMLGLKVDNGLIPFEGSDTLSITKGLTALPLLLQSVIAMDKQIVFTKWRSVIPVRGHTPAFLKKVSSDLALYAKVVLNAGMVPIIEPEVLLQGNHSMQESQETLTLVLRNLIQALIDAKVSPRDCILKTSFALHGNSSSQVDAEGVAASTIDALETVRDASAEENQFAGIVFLSGGLSPMAATSCLAHTIALARIRHYDIPITFSYGRALQQEALETWGGDVAKVQDAKRVFLNTVERNSRALTRLPQQRGQQ